MTLHAAPTRPLADYIYADIPAEHRRVWAWVVTRQVQIFLADLCWSAHKAGRAGW